MVNLSNELALTGGNAWSALPVLRQAATNEPILGNQTLWVRLDVSTNASTKPVYSLLAGYPPKDCSTPQPTPVGTLFPPPTPSPSHAIIPPNCLVQSGTPNFCPLATGSPNDEQILAFVLSCESDNIVSPDSVADITGVILNRMRSQEFNAVSAVQVVEQSGQFQCYYQGAQIHSAIALASGTPFAPAVTAAHQLLALTPMVTLTTTATINPAIPHIGLYYFGDGFNSPLVSVTPDAVRSSLPAHHCDVTTYLGHDPFPLPTLVPTIQNFVNSFFSDASNCQ